MGKGGGDVSVTDINDDANVTIVGYYSTTQSFRSAIDNSLSKYEVINYFFLCVDTCIFSLIHVYSRRLIVRLKHNKCTYVSFESNCNCKLLDLSLTTKALGTQRNRISLCCV